MAKYEIMLVVDGELEEAVAREGISNLTALFSGTENFEEKVTLGDQLAYAIKKKTLGHRFLFNFETSDIKVINEFNRLVLFNKVVLRHLVVNLEKNYGWKGLHNPKKIKISEYRQNKFQEYLAMKAKAIAKAKATAIAGADVVEAGMRKVRRYDNVDTHPETKKDE